MKPGIILREGKSSNCCTYVVPIETQRASSFLTDQGLLVAGKIEISNEFIEDLVAIASLE